MGPRIEPLLQATYISQDAGAREQDVATTSGRRSSFEGRCVDPASPTQGEGFEAARGPPPDSGVSRILSTVFFKQAVDSSQAWTSTLKY